MTGFSENMTLTNSKNGSKNYLFATPLAEEYGLAKEPYREFREGIDLTTFQEKDSIDVQDTRLTADYAIQYTKRMLWEARGNVVVKKSDGEELYTQQVFWNEKTGRIWSNVDTRIVRGEGRGEQFAQGFESDQSFKSVRFRRPRGRMYVDVEPNPEADTTAVNKP